MKKINQLPEESLFEKILSIVSFIAFTLICLYGVYGILTSDSKDRRAIIDIEETSDTLTFTFSDGNSYIFYLDATAYNRSNIKLLYIGKDVWVRGARMEILNGSQTIKMIKEKDLYRVTPVKQESMPMLTKNQCYELLMDCFTDFDIEYSFQISKGVANLN